MVEVAERPEVGRDLAWLAGLLWPEAAPAPAPPGAPAVRVSTDGTVPAGYRAVERFAVVPSLRRARFLVPLATRRAAWASTARYNALRPVPTRARRAAIGIGMRAGLAQRALRDRLLVCVPAGAGEDELPELLIGEWLRRALGVPALAVGVGVAERHPNRKPTLQLFAPDGAPLGYAKIGWNSFTADLVRNEARALRACAERQLSAPAVPRVLHQGRWHDLEVVVTSPLPAGVRRWRPSPAPPLLDVTCEVAGDPRRLPLGESPYWRRLRDLAGQAAAHQGGELAATLAAYLGSLERHAATPLDFGRWHGDWVPWNLARHGGRLHAWDWEHASDDAPLGFDVLHWRFQVAFVHQGRPAAEAARRSLDGARADLAALGLDDRAAQAAGSLYLLELFLRGFRMMAAGGGWNPRFHPHMLRVLADHAGS